MGTNSKFHKASSFCYPFHSLLTLLGWLHNVQLALRYLAPEYFMHGVVDEKTDVFAFGVLLLELITGRRAVDSSRQSLVIWVCKHQHINIIEHRKFSDLF